MSIVTFIPFAHLLHPCILAHRRRALAEHFMYQEIQRHFPVHEKAEISRPEISASNLSDYDSILLYDMECPAGAGIRHVLRRTHAFHFCVQSSVRGSVYSSPSASATPWKVHLPS